MPTLIKRQPLMNVLEKRKAVTGDRLDRLLEAANGSESRLREMLIEQGLLSDSQMAEMLAEQYGIIFIALDGVQIDLEAFHSIKPDWMVEYCFLPIEENERTLVIAVPDPQDLPALDRIERLLDRPLEIVVASRTAIHQALRARDSNGRMISQIQSEFRPVLVQEKDDGEEVLSVEKITNDQSPVVRLVNTIILTALQKRASDIHIEPSDGMSEVKYRIDGILYPAMEPVAFKFHRPLVSRIKVMAELDIAESRIPQDGRFKLRLDQRTIDFRVSILPSAFGESVVIRILAKEEFLAANRGLHLDALGLRPDDLRRFRRAITAAYGMVLVTGPTGSGKTTTLYAAINEVNTKEDKFITIEDPVEYQLKGVVQIPVNEKKGLTFARGLRSILRHDPDKIMVGEIRDAETAQIAIQSALTGHLVFTTVHANNTFDVIGRFVNMGIEPYNFVSSLNCIMAQRLVRSLCQSCRVPMSLTRAQCEDLGFDYGKLKDHTIYEGKGCADCLGLGYRGRQAITEFLLLSDPVKELILARHPISEIRQVAHEEGMSSLREAGLTRVLRGETSLREVNRMTFTG